MFAMDPYWFDEEYSVILLGPHTSPGSVTLSGHDREKNWDVQAAKGAAGASTNLGGDPVGKFAAEFYLANEKDPETNLSDIDRWEDFQRYCESLVNGPKPVAAPVYHPDLARNRFTEVTIAKIYGLRHDGRGGMIAKIDFLEYKPPKPAPAKKSAAGTGANVRQGATTVSKPDPNALRKAELAALLDQARRP